MRKAQAALSLVRMGVNRVAAGRCRSIRSAKHLAESGRRHRGLVQSAWALPLAWAAVVAVSAVWLAWTVARLELRYSDDELVGLAIFFPPAAGLYAIAFGLGIGMLLRRLRARVWLQVLV